MKKLLIAVILLFLVGCTAGYPPDYEKCYPKKDQESLCSLVLSGKSSPELTLINPNITSKNVSIGGVYWLSCGQIGPNTVGVSLFEKEGYLCQVTETNAKKLFTPLIQEEALTYFDLIYEMRDPDTGLSLRQTIYNQTADRYLVNIDPSCEQGFSSARKPTQIEHIENYFDIQRVLVKEEVNKSSVWYQELRVSEAGLTRIDREKFIYTCSKN